MKKIFLDCGTHLGQGLKHFLQKGVFDASWEVHAFEANPACAMPERVRELGFKVIPHECAVWISDGTVAFFQENHTISKSESPTDGRSNVDGWGSSVSQMNADHAGYESEVVVPSIDFSRFVRELPEPAEIVCKLNIEGSEFPVLRRMLAEGTIGRISKLFIEFHPMMIPSETDESVRELRRQVEQHGVVVDADEIYAIPYSV